MQTDLFTTVHANSAYSTATLKGTGSRIHRPNYVKPEINKGFLDF